jgi:ABC-type uncharacterized transport system fused permease/ATPase subunit
MQKMLDIYSIGIISLEMWSIVFLLTWSIISMNVASSLAKEELVRSLAQRDVSLILLSLIILKISLQSSVSLLMGGLWSRYLFSRVRSLWKVGMSHPDLPQFWTAVSPKGYINNKLTIGWLQKFHEATKDRTKKGEKHVLIFDGHESYKTVEFLQLCEFHDIIPFCFRPHTTHICQPLDGKPFLAYKQHFRQQNNLIAQ